MRRKQLYALAMAGILAVSAVPTNTYASVFKSTVENQTPSAIDEGNDPTVTPVPTTTPTPTPQPSKENNNLTVGNKTYTSWKAAIDAIKDKGTIIVNSDATVEETVVIPAGKEITVIASKDVSIKRGKDFTGDMFKISKGIEEGENKVKAGQLIIDKMPVSGSEKEDAVYTITVDGTYTEEKEDKSNKEADASKKEIGTILNVESGATLTVYSKTVLKNNKTTKNGGAILNSGTTALEGAVLEANSAEKGGAIYNTGSLTLKNSEIQKNTSDLGGGIYTEKDIAVAGLVKVINNTKASDAKAPNNVYLSKESKLKQLVVNNGKEDTVDSISKDSKISVLAASAGSGVSVAETGIVEACGVSYDSAFWKVNSNGTLDRQLTAVTTSLVREKNKIKVSYNFPCNAQYYTAWTKKGEPTPNIDTSGNGVVVDAGKQEIIFEDVSSEAVSIYLIAKDEYGYTSHLATASISAYEEGDFSEGKFDDCSFTLAATSVTKGTSIELKAKGDGIGNTDPKKGSIRWVPYSWVLTNSTGSEEVASGYIVKDDNGNSVEDKNYQSYEDKEYSVKISTNDLSIKSYKIKAVFVEQEFNGEQWAATGNEQAKTAKTVTVKKAPTSKPTKKATSTPKAKTTSKSAKNAKTGDESPILPMSMLAMGALFAGGYVLVRRRKASDDMDR